MEDETVYYSLEEYLVATDQWQESDYKVQDDGLGRFD